LQEYYRNLERRTVKRETKNNNCNINYCVSQEKSVFNSPQKALTVEAQSRSPSILQLARIELDNFFEQFLLIFLVV